jgi:hypothetical protein
MMRGQSLSCVVESAPKGQTEGKKKSDRRKEIQTEGKKKSDRRKESQKRSKKK